MNLRFLFFFSAVLWNLGGLLAQEVPAEDSGKPAHIPGRLTVPTSEKKTEENITFEVPQPAHAVKSSSHRSASGFRVTSSRNSAPNPPEEMTAPADYLLPDRNEKPAITPENSNLNLPNDLTLTSTDTGESIFLPAGTYRQILQLPLDSPLMQAVDQTRRDQGPPVKLPTARSRYAEPETKPIWVRYESLEKIKIGDVERRGGIDLPSHGPKGTGPRVWYAKSEKADVASSVFYFVFGGLGYSTANLLGWSSGNTREIPGDFEYRLIRR